MTPIGPDRASPIGSPSPWLRGAAGHGAGGGTLLEDPLDVPWPAVEFLAEQLEIGDASYVKKYVQRPQTPYEHAWEIRDRLRLPVFDDPGCAGGVRTVSRGSGLDSR